MRDDPWRTPPLLGESRARSDPCPSEFSPTPRSARWLGSRRYARRASGDEPFDRSQLVRYRVVVPVLEPYGAGDLALHLSYGCAFSLVRRRIIADEESWRFERVWQQVWMGALRW